MKVTVGQITDRGLNPKRPTNEDNLLAMPDRGLYLVADGVGGRLGGEVASRTVVEVFAKVFSQRHPEDLRTIIESVIDFCNQKIYEDARSNNELDGMATTIALLAVEGKRGVIAHVGDSRVYRFDEKGLILLTEDHSEVSEALRAGIITPEQAAQHPRRNVISRALGAEPEVEADFREIEIDGHTSFLLCTDGVTRHITDDEIRRLMKSGRRPEAICQRVKELCYMGGAEDNLTAVVVDFGQRQYVEEQTRPRPPAAAAQAQAAAAPPPRQANRIEVELKPASSAAERQGGQSRSASSNMSGEGGGPQPALPPQPQSGDGESGAEKTKEKAPAPKKRSGGLLLKGELSKAMKMSLLIIALIAGVVIGVLFGGQLTAMVYRLIGIADPYETRHIAYRPKDPEINAAFARHLDGRSDDARSRINAALTANPNNAEAHFFLGRIELDQKRYEEAETHLSQAAKLDATLPDVRIHLALAYLGLGQASNAKDALQRIIASPSPSPSTNASTTEGAPVR
jgi:serine/threonine protein phosphatase PrpC/TolA-binding protein